MVPACKENASHDTSKRFECMHQPARPCLHHRWRLVKKRFARRLTSRALCSACRGQDSITRTSLFRGKQYPTHACVMKMVITYHDIIGVSTRMAVEAWACKPGRSGKCRDSCGHAMLTWCLTSDKRRSARKISLRRQRTALSRISNRKHIWFEEMGHTETSTAMTQ